MCIALLALGVFVGIIFGSIPGLTATLGVTLFIPFTYTMQPVQGLVMLIAVYVGGISGGLITATLINIPGTPSSIYTCFDGYPMTKKGKPAQALAIGVFCSLIGGSFSAFALMAIAPQLAKVSLSFGSWEYFAVALMGLSVVVAMCSDSLIKGLLGAVFGLLIDMAPVILGFILGPLIEKYMRMALISANGNWADMFNRPVSVFFVVIAILFVVVPVIKKAVSQGKKKA